MKNVINFILIICSFGAQAQQKLAADNTGSMGYASPMSVQVFAGSQGLGADFKYGFLPKLSGRAGFGIIPVSLNNPVSFSSFPSDDKFSAKFSNIHLLADFQPFSALNLRIVGGGAYIVKGNANVTITPNGSYSFGNTTITKDQIGELSAAMNWKGVAPYLGFSFFKGFPNNRFNVNMDLGTYYLSSPNAFITGTKLLSDNSSQSAQFNQNVHDYRWLPVLQVNFNYRIK